MDEWTNQKKKGREREILMKFSTMFGAPIFCGDKCKTWAKSAIDQSDLNANLNAHNEIPALTLTNIETINTDRWTDRQTIRALGVAHKS